ncbi:hypothetical protein Pjdr2_5873 [Paenibacillus sp. JDR-2]|nr:hypothetical protein Pjdr2_5873 [Paenibacillus sp. JDR-2]
MLHVVQDIRRSRLFLRKTLYILQDTLQILANQSRFTRNILQIIQFNSNKWIIIQKYNAFFAMEKVIYVRVYKLYNAKQKSL